jgi:pre-rRNA-processing protein RIX1
MSEWTATLSHSGGLGQNLGGAAPKRDAEAGSAHPACSGETFLRKKSDIKKFLQHHLLFHASHILIGSMEQLGILRSTAHRLNATPVDELPRIALFLSSSFASCSKILANTDESKGIEFASHLQKYRTRISSLSQDRSVSGRLTAAILIKTYVEVVRPVEAAQWETWARALTISLNKPDPWEVKQVYIASAGKIFMLCKTSPTLLREVASPLFPAFLTAVLASLRPSVKTSPSTNTVVPSPLMIAAFKCLRELLPHYSQTFRPFNTRLRQICTSLLNDTAVPKEVQKSALRLLSALHLCSPKTSALAEWDKSISDVIVAVHQSANMLFRAVIEDWEPANAAVSQLSSKQNYNREPELPIIDAAGLSPWQGLQAGCHRVVALLKWVGHVLGTTSQTSSIPLGALVHLITRLFYVYAPTTGQDIKTNPEVSRDEREELYSYLPTVHYVGLQVATALINSLQGSIAPVAASLASLMTHLHSVAGWQQTVRASLYDTMKCLLNASPHGFTSWHLSGLFAMVRAACHDLTANSSHLDDMHANGRKLDRALNDMSSKASPAIASSRLASVPNQAAMGLVQSFLNRMPSRLHPHSLRTEIDRVLILTGDDMALASSVLNPPSSIIGGRVQPSLLPFLMRSELRVSSVTDLILRPRLTMVAIAHEPRNGHDPVEQIEEAEDELAANEQIDYQEMAVSETPALPVISNEFPSPLTESNKRALNADVIMTAPPNPEEEQKAKRIRIHSSDFEGADAAHQQSDASKGHLLKLGLPEAHNQQISSFAAAEAVTIHGTTDAAEGILPPIGGPDEDDSDIPEIDPQLATDDEE